MPKNKGGKKFKRGKKGKDEEHKKLDILKEEGQEYARVLERKGGPILSVQLLTGETVLGVIRGKLRKRMWMSPGDIILVGIRDFQSDKVDVIHKYSYEHSRQLVKTNQIPDYFFNDSDEDNMNKLRSFAKDNNDWQSIMNKLKKKLNDYMTSENSDAKKIKEIKLKIEKHLEKKQTDNQPVSDDFFNSI